jgi:hypothetical protein
VAASTSLTPEQRRLRAQLAANIRWAGTDRGKGRRQYLFTRYVREIAAASPELSDPEVATRAESAVKAHMQRLALKSSTARARRAGGDEAA